MLGLGATHEPRIVPSLSVNSNTRSPNRRPETPHVIQVPSPFQTPSPLDLSSLLYQFLRSQAHPPIPHRGPLQPLAAMSFPVPLQKAQALPSQAQRAC